MGSTYASQRPGWAFPKCRISDPEWRCGFKRRKVSVALAPGGVRFDGQVYDPSIFPTGPLVRFAVALGHVRARARMERFMAWLRERMVHDRVVGRAALHASPEAAMLAESGLRRDVFAMVGGGWDARYWLHPSSILAEELTGSGRWRERGPDDAWTDLPWQRDPEVRQCQ